MHTHDVVSLTHDVASAKRSRTLALHASMFAVVAGQMGYASAQIFSSSGVYFGDDWLHLLKSREVLHHWVVALSIWARPMTTLAYVPAAHSGLIVVHLEDVLFLAGTVAATMAVAKALDLRWWPAAGILLLAQPYLVVLSYGAMPELPFCVILSVALLLRARRHPTAALLVASLLPLARLEGVVVIAMWALVEWRSGHWRRSPLLGAGIVAWAVIGGLAHHDALWLVSKNEFLASHAQYGAAGWRFVLTAAPVVFGGVVCGLAVGAIARHRFPDELVPGVTAALVAVYTISWGVGSFQTTDTPIYLVSICVPVSLLALHAIGSSARGVPWWRDAIVVVLAIAVATAPAFPSYYGVSSGVPSLTVSAAVLVLLVGRLRARRRAPAFALCSLALVGAAGLGVATETSISLARAQPLTARVLEHLLTNPTRIAASADLAVAYLTGAQKSPGPFASGIEHAPIGAIALWESTPPNMVEHGVSLRDVLRDGYRELWRVRVGHEVAVLLRRETSSAATTEP
jgi:hypothetical protein